MPGSKCYLITLGVLAPAHAGVQGAHAMHELAERYLFRTDYTGKDIARAVYDMWRVNKTVVLVNGGMAEDMRTLLKLAADSRNDVPYAAFNESQEFLNGMLTAIAVVLPPGLADWEPINTIERLESEEEGKAKAYGFENLALYQLVRTIRSLPLVR